MLGELYRNLGLFQNFFHPSTKLVEKTAGWGTGCLAPPEGIGDQKVEGELSAALETYNHRLSIGRVAGVTPISRVPQ